LRLGENVDFTAKINYDLGSANGGRILWFFANSGDVQTILATMLSQAEREASISRRAFK